MSQRLRRIQIGILPAVLLATGGVGTLLAQPAPLTLPPAVVSQWVVNQQRVGEPGAVRAVSPDFRVALAR